MTEAAAAVVGRQIVVPVLIERADGPDNPTVGMRCFTTRRIGGAERVAKPFRQSAADLEVEFAMPLAVVRRRSSGPRE
jgi:hypothetical protein